MSTDTSQDLVEIMQSLPPYEDCWRLYQAFKFRVHPIVPIVHLPTLEKLAVEFWNDFPFSMHGDTLALLLAVTYCGLISVADEQYIDLSASLHRSYNKLMRSYDFPADITKSTVPRLQSYILINTCRASQTEPLASFGFLPSAVRIAQALKLHVEKKSSSDVDLEVRRRIWWHLIYLDMEASLLSGLPILIHDDDYSTRMPSEVDDDAIGGASISRIADIKSPMMIAMKSRWLWASQMRRWRRRPPTGGELELFEQTIAGHLSNIPNTKQNSGPRIYVELQVDRAICLTPRHFMYGKAVRSVHCDHHVLK